jgi:hypothetical protein
MMLALFIVLLLFITVECLVNVKIETTYKPAERDSTVEYSSTGDKMTVSYIGYIDESSQVGSPGTVVDATAKDSLEFFLGSAETAVFNRGLNHMCVGEKRTLVVPPEYIDSIENIAEGVTLKYEVELLDLTKKDSPAGKNLFAIIDENGDNQLSYFEIEKWFKAKHGGEVEMSASVLTRDDVNKDGFISWDEFRGPKGNKAPATEVQEEL